MSQPLVPDSMGMHFVRSGIGEPLLLIHGLGGSWRSWEPILQQLTATRDVIAVDLPGFGTTPPLPGTPSISNMVGYVSDFLRTHGLEGVDVVGSSMGARLVLELARQGVVGSVVSLDPGGFWKGAETTFFGVSVGLSIKLINAIQSQLPWLTRNPISRTLLLAQFSAHPWKLPASLVLQELRNYAASPSFEPMLHELVRGPVQGGATPLSDRRSITIGWGRHDRVCFPKQAARARAVFPQAKFHWFENSGHFPMWDSPDETVKLILANTGRNAGGESRS